MYRQEQIATVVDSQKERFLQKGQCMDREALAEVPVLESFATIISGIRRCGKSTLLHQLIRERYPDAFFLNFEDIRLSGFEVDDFTRLYSEIVDRGIRVMCFDEIQLIKNWEMFVHQLLREGYQVFVTGSNASLLSRELGTHLTGRYLSMELFPFSYNEFVSFKGLEKNSESVQAYLVSGGMPEFVKSGEGMVLSRLIDDILIRDISVRQSIRDVEILRQLTVYLLTNVGNLIAATKLTGMYGVKSATTFLEYFSFLRDAYLVEFVPQFSYSLKAQARNPKKVYAVDLGFVSEVATLFTDNLGRRFENLIYLHLRRKYSEIYYYKDKGECDFVVHSRGKVEKLVQVCYQTDDLNFQREYSGLVEAMKFFQMNEGTIVTLNQKDVFEKDGYTVKLLPAHEFLI
ncbi:MAG: ATP-binding protein [Bacteroidota bacterium]|nr:ATP-binding protein [Bacteroidota bacterium]